MPLFTISNSVVQSVPSTNFSLETQLQKLVEENLEVIFNCRFVASEFVTGVKHGGRIDTLALSEDNNPVIIEYKKVESSELINQSLYYLAWIQDHRGDFEMAVQRQLGRNTEVDWSDLRVICLAPGYRKYDLHAVEVMGANIELWRYRLFADSVLYLEEIYGQEPVTTVASETNGKNPVMVKAGKKAAITRATGSYTFDEHIAGKPETIKELARAVQDYILALDASIEEAPKKNYVAYKTTQNIACLEIHHNFVRLFLKLKPEDIEFPPRQYRDVSNIGHFGTGDAEFNLRSIDDLEETATFIEQSYRKVGG
jgi:predicted transport protein